MTAIVWSKPNCPHCEQAKQLLATKNINFEVRVIGSDWTKEQLLEAAPNARTVPQIFIDNEYVGGINELRKRVLS